MCIIGNTSTCENGDSSNADAILNIGGRQTTDDVEHNPPMIDISNALVYDRVIAKWEIENIQVTLKAGMSNTFFEKVSVLTAG